MNESLYGYKQPVSARQPDKALSIHGRFGRLSYLAWIVSLSIISSVLAFTIFFAFWISALAAGPLDPNILNAINMLIFIIISIIFIALLYFIVIFSIRRLHDLNQTGWLSLLLIVPPVNFIFGLYLAVAKGSPAPNQYGPQRITQGWEKALGWIYLVSFALSFALWAVFSGSLSKILS